MQRGRLGNPYKTALAALKADVAGWQRQIAATEVLIADLTVRAGGGTSGNAGGNAAVVPPKKCRRRRHKSRPAIVRKAKRGIAAKRVAIPVAAPEPVAAKAKAVRGAVQFADQLEELKKLFVTIDTDDADATRAYKIIVELKGRARLPEEYTKAVRMRLKRRAAAATKPGKRAAVSAPKKKKAPRKPAVPIPAPIVRRTDWHPDPDGSGNLVREIITS